MFLQYSVLCGWWFHASTQQLYLTLERRGAGRSVFIGIHGHISHKKNRRGSKLRRNVKDQYLRKVKFIQRKKKFSDGTAAIFKSKWPKLGRPVFLVLSVFIGFHLQLCGVWSVGDQQLKIELFLYHTIGIKVSSTRFCMGNHICEPSQNTSKGTRWEDWSFSSEPAHRTAKAKNTVLLGHVAAKRPNRRRAEL